MTSQSSTFTATARQELVADFTELLTFADRMVGKYMDEYGDTKEQAVARFVEHMQAA